MLSSSHLNFNEIRTQILRNYYCILSDKIEEKLEMLDKPRKFLSRL